uniref:Uncharacterized protein n=1 Tax=Arundo donax TaxID=35708 RepID=A0A0A8Z9Y5_ARUDO
MLVRPVCPVQLIPACLLISDLVMVVSAEVS